MITVNPITISSPTRFQVSFDLVPPYAQDSIKVAGDGKWSVQCGVVERLTTNPVPEYGTIFTEGAHNIAPHKGEPVPCVSALRNHTGVDVETTPWDPDYPPDTYAIAMDPVPHGDAGHFDKVWMVYSKTPGVPRAWRVDVNCVHGTEAEVVDAHRRRHGGCLVPWWWWPLPFGPDHASANFRQMLDDGQISVGPERAEPAAAPEPEARSAPKARKKGKK